MDMEQEGLVEQHDVEMASNARLDMSRTADHHETRPPQPADSGSFSTTAKRPRSPSCEGSDSVIGRKRLREEGDTLAPPGCGAQGSGTTSCPSPSTSFPTSQPTATTKFNTLVENLAQELQCGCCAELVYHPVVVSPCQHFFCGRYVHTCPVDRGTDVRGSCCFLWIKVEFFFLFFPIVASVACPNPGS